MRLSEGRSGSFVSGTRRSAVEDRSRRESCPAWRSCLGDTLCASAASVRPRLQAQPAGWWSASRSFILAPGASASCPGRRGDMPVPSREAAAAGRGQRSALRCTATGEVANPVPEAEAERSRFRAGIPQNQVPCSTCRRQIAHWRTVTISAAGTAWLPQPVPPGAGLAPICRGVVLDSPVAPPSQMQPAVPVHPGRRRQVPRPPASP